LGVPSVTGGHDVRYPDVEAAWTPLLLSAGAGLLDCQRLEYGLGLLLLYLGKSGVTGIDIDRIRAVLDEEAVCTAGQLRNLLAGKVDISPEDHAVLSEGLKSRNHLVHRFLIANAGRVTGPSQIDPVIEELRQLRLKVQAAEHLVRPLVDQLSIKLDGVSLSDYLELSLRIFRSQQKNP
jgi:hypothetical protein